MYKDNMSARAAQQLRREITSMKALNHPNVLRLKDVHEVHGVAGNNVIALQIFFSRRRGCVRDSMYFFDLGIKGRLYPKGWHGVRRPARLENSTPDNQSCASLTCPAHTRHLAEFDVREEKWTRERGGCSCSGAGGRG